MDSMKIQKHQAMRNYKIKAQIFCVKIAVYSLAALISSLSYLCIFWFPTMKYFVSIYLPTIYSIFFSSKFLFLLANFIVVILIGDSKFRSGNSCESYNECISKSRGIKVNHMKKQHLMSSNEVSKAEIVRVQDQVLHPLKSVTSCNEILYDVTKPKKGMASNPILRPLKTVRSRNNLVLNGVTDPKKSISSKTQRKTPKRHVHEKTVTTITHDQKDNSIIEEVVGLAKEVNDMELQESAEKSSTCNGEEIEKIEVHCDDEGGKCNGNEEEEEEEIYVYHDPDSLQREELNRKVEDFIARVNRRRMLEAGEGAY